MNSASRAVLQQLPYLRRYARVLSGSGRRPEPAFLIAKPFQLAIVSQALFFGRKARQRGCPRPERQAPL